MAKKLTTNEFIVKSRAVHGDRYDYSKVNYIDNKTKVRIICAEHGEFEQTPANHTQGLGCLKCGFKNAGQYHKKDTSAFINEARKLHGNYYDYNKTVYKGAREKLTVICPKHGPFGQTAFVHLRSEPKAACLDCSYENRAEKLRMKFDDFLNQAKVIHEDFYDYSDSAIHFTDGSEKIAINCPKHGKFYQSPVNHLLGQGCPHCGLEKVAQSLTKTSEEFINDCLLIHGKKYDYSLVDYKGAFEPVKIICSTDGVFEQMPTTHLRGIGCPKCSRRDQGAPRNLTRALRGEFDDEKASFVYIVSFNLPCSPQRLFKIGSGTGTRRQTVTYDIKRIGGTEISVQQIDFSSSGEAIVFEHLAHEQVQQFKFPVPSEFKFPGYSEVFTVHPNIEQVSSHPSLQLFKSGERTKIVLPDSDGSHLDD